MPIGTWNGKNWSNEDLGQWRWKQSVGALKLYSISVTVARSSFLTAGNQRGLKYSNVAVSKRKREEKRERREEIFVRFQNEESPGLLGRSAYTFSTIQWFFANTKLSVHHLHRYQIHLFFDNVPTNDNEAPAH